MNMSQMYNGSTTIEDFFPCLYNCAPDWQVAFLHVVIQESRFLLRRLCYSLRSPHHVSLPGKAISTIRDVVWTRSGSGIHHFAHILLEGT